ncbi:hypothetical protein NG271_729 [Saccharomyces cerevisiae synthetic construct]|uniref:Putative uncharacterized protein YDR455C n=1 Tax=Saccharomyces cerevisiae (strain ATCC 204508 / S288c) TaxID=559292 RepID=YD455_YEAST|nr:RecName: Full=Putative uncharacterized protein YDR455C [Saccharomyces cerevisiae S288C]AAB64898.1 Ydr455cp [Saccharomyces cerevisiae]KZV12695.1 hypothetical protein WN66_01541 [Saccharomyces cerevisiae]WNF20279.1 hypothetical protein NG271_729 [Saccharomyces cerevisiae synthetic construct]
MNNAHEENISSVTGFKSTSGSPAIGSSLPGRSGEGRSSSSSSGSTALLAVVNSTLKAIFSNTLDSIFHMVCTDSDKRLSSEFHCLQSMFNLQLFVNLGCPLS